MKIIYKISKQLHKYLGLILCIFLILMSISGIILNHPDLVSEIEIPKQYVPESYYLQNWNRSAAIGGIVSKYEYIFGHQGIWVSKDNGKTLHSYMKGVFPKKAYTKRTRSMTVSEYKGETLLYAAVQNGLYICNENDGIWEQLIKTEVSEPFIKVLKANNKILAFTNSNLYLIQGHNIYSTKFGRIEAKARISMLNLFFELHDGRFLGFPGRLIFDISGLVMIFLSIGAFYIFLFPRKNKIIKLKILLKGKGKVLFKYFYKYHLKLGILFSFVLILMAFTGMFMRPPLVVAILDGSIPAEYFPGIMNSNPWHGKIRNAVFDVYSQTIDLDCKDGYWTAPVDQLDRFIKSKAPAPIFPMGATVFEILPTGNILIGSFSGLFEINTIDGSLSDYLSQTAANSQISLRPGPNMITGYFRNRAGEEYNFDYYKGIEPIGNSDISKYQMPDEISSNFALSLWNFMFELHNGRIFESLIGNSYILIIPLGGLLTLILLLGGTYDLLYIKFRKRIK